MISSLVLFFIVETWDYETMTCDYDYDYDYDHVYAGLLAISH